MPATSTEWARILATTIAKYMKGVQVELVARQKLLALLESRGRITYGVSGDGVAWDVEYREIPLAVNNLEQAITPQRQDAYKQPFLDIAGYNVADVMTKRERLKNGSGPSQIVDYFKKMVTRSTRNLRRQFGEEFYVDSSASGNANRLSGFETFMATSGTVNISTGATRSANAADVVGYPSDTYAGLSTILGNYGGTWTSQAGIDSTWPAGRGTLNYDFFSPVIVCYNSTAWAGAANDWASNCLKATRYGVTHMQRYDDGATAVKKVFLDRGLYRSFLDKQDSKEHMYVESKYSLRAMGFESTFLQDGVEISWEWGIPGAVGYGFNVDNIELMSWQDDLFDVRGPTFEPLLNAWHVIVDFGGQVRFETPKFFMKLMTIAA